jgi:Na+-driven multidrug efflux pump
LDSAIISSFIWTWALKVSFCNHLLGAAIARNLTQLITLILLYFLVNLQKLTTETMIPFSFNEAWKDLFKFFKAATLIGSIITLEQTSYEIFVIQASRLPSKYLNGHIIIVNISTIMF